MYNDYSRTYTAGYNGRQRTTSNSSISGNITNNKRKSSVITPVANSGESGIIREESTKPITPITDKVIERVPKVNICGHSDEQCIEIQKQHKELLEYSRRYNNNNEVAFVFKQGLSERKEFTGTDDKLDFGTYLIGKGNGLTILHNHPRNSSFSLNDLSVFIDNDCVKTFSIIKNNGCVEYITKNDDYVCAKFKTEYYRLYTKMFGKQTTITKKMKDKFVKTLLSKTQSGVIWSERI